MKQYSIGAVTITFTDETNNGFRKVTISQEGRPDAIDWQPKRSKCTRKEAQHFARKHGEYAGNTLIEINITTYSNMNLWLQQEANA
jgi:hypothetical protein